jgi:23S rRNA pseudouridine1911/1915/1917 synthase
MAEAALAFGVEAGEAGLRLDLFLARRLPGRSRAFAAQLIAGGRVTVNDRPQKPGQRLKPGDRVAVVLPAPEPARCLPEPIPLDILFEDGHVVVLNKPPGLVVHPAPGHCRGTLVNALLHHCPDLGAIGGELRPGIVHRLDKDTSGVLVAAKNAAALEGLARQFKARTVRKGYLALVHGAMSAASGVIRLPIGRHPVDRKRMSTASRRPREAETGWRVRRRFPQASLLELELRTGRTHQIRVHLAAVGRPIVGDPVYGRGKGAGVAAARQMLHAWRLEFDHPRTGERLSFEAPVPADMAALLEGLGAGAPAA